MNDIKDLLIKRLEALNTELAHLKDTAEQLDMAKKSVCERIVEVIAVQSEFNTILNHHHQSQKNPDS